MIKYLYFFIFFSFALFTKASGQDTLPTKMADEICTCINKDKTNRASTLNKCMASSFLKFAKEIIHYLNLKPNSTYQESHKAGEKLRIEIIQILKKKKCIPI